MTTLSYDPEHPADTEALPDEETREARKRRLRREAADARGLVAEESRNEALADETQDMQVRMWGRSAVRMDIEVADEFTSRRLFEWTDL